MKLMIASDNALGAALLAAVREGEDIWTKS